MKKKFLGQIFFLRSGEPNTTNTAPFLTDKGLSASCEAGRRMRKHLKRSINRVHLNCADNSRAKSTLVMVQHHFNDLDAKILVSNILDPASDSISLQNAGERLLNFFHEKCLEMLKKEKPTCVIAITHNTLIIWMLQKFFYNRAKKVLDYSTFVRIDMFKHESMIHVKLSFCGNRADGIYCTDKKRFQ